MKFTSVAIALLAFAFSARAATVTYTPGTGVLLYPENFFEANSNSIVQAIAGAFPGTGSGNASTNVAQGWNASQTFLGPVYFGTTNAVTELAGKQNADAQLDVVAGLTSGTSTNFLAGDGTFKQVTTNMIPGLAADIAAAAASGSGGGDVVTTADNVLSGVNQFTNGLGQVFSVPPRVLGGRINGWMAPQMTPGTNAATQAQYKVLGDGIPALEFDGATSEEISMVGLLSQDPDRGSFVTVTFASDDTANTVCWQAQWQLLTLRGIDTNLLSTAATWTSNIPGTARVPTNITFSLNAPTGLVGSTNDFSKPYMLRITRLPGSDSSLSNAYLIGVDHRYGR